MTLCGPTWGSMPRGANMGSGCCLPPMPGFSSPMAPIPLWGNSSPLPPTPGFFGGFGPAYGLPPQIYNLLGLMAMFSSMMGMHSGCSPHSHAHPPVYPPAYSPSYPPQPVPQLPPPIPSMGSTVAPAPGAYQVAKTEAQQQNASPSVNYPSLVSPMAEATLNWANGELGISEQQNPERVRFYSKGAWQHWCADFVTTAIEQTTGRKAPWDRGGYNSSSVSEIKRWGQDNGRFLPKGGPQPPLRGDVIILQGRISHTGFVKRIEGDKVVVVSGNSYDKVRESTYSLKDPALVGFVRPWGDL